MFIPRHEATFTSSPGAGSFTDDSERMVERLVYADSPSRDDTSEGQQVIDVTVKINGLSKSDVEEIVDNLPCVHLEKPSPSSRRFPCPPFQLPPLPPFSDTGNPRSGVPPKVPLQ